MSKTLKVALIGLLTLCVVAQPIAAAQVDTVDPNADAAHNPWVEVPVTHSEYEVGDDPTAYEANDGSSANLPARLNESDDNPYSFVLSDVESDALNAFSRGTASNTYITNAANWTTDASGTAGSGSVADVETAPGVDAVRISTSSQTSGDTFKATFSDVSITTDAEKRYMQSVVDVNTLDSGATVSVRLKDADGDYVQQTIDTADNATKTSSIANSTGEGFAAQERIGEMTVSGTGDGTMGEIQSAVVVVNDADASVDIAGMNADKLSAWEFGEQMKDTDGDGDMETVTVTQNPDGGAVEMSDPLTSSAFDGAVVHDMTVPLQFLASMATPQDDEQVVNATAVAADGYPSFDKMLTDQKRIHLPSAYDITYGTAELKSDTAVPSSRYQSVQYTTSAGTTNFSDLTWTDATNQFGATGEDVTLANSGFGAGDSVAVEYEYPMTAEEFEDYTTMDTGDAGGSGGGIFGGGGDSGGLMDRLGVIFGGLLGLLGLNKLRGGS